jgi:hypothetical protein
MDAQSVQRFKSAFRRFVEVGDDSKPPEALGMLQTQIAILEDCQHTDDLHDLVAVVKGVKAALAQVKGHEHPAVVSHRKQIEDVLLPPVERLIVNLRKDDRGLPAGRDGVRGALVDGDLGTRIQDPTFRGQVMSWLDTVDDPDPAVKGELLAAFRAAPGTDGELRQKIFGKVFRCGLTSTVDGVPTAVPAATLDKIADIIEGLPKEHLPGSWDLQGTSGMTASSGSWDPDNQKATFEYGVDDAPDFQQAYLNAEPGEALEGTKCFDLMIRHEIGHAVDTRNGGSALTSTTAGGGWRIHGAFEDVVPLLASQLTSFAQALVGPLGLETAPDGDAIGKALAGVGQTNLQAPDKLRTALGSALEKAIGTANIGILRGITKFSEKKVAVARAIPMDHALIRIVLQGAQPNPYFKLGSDPIAHEGRVYLNAENDNGWVSFERATWSSKVSMYQYRSPGEWFAEFYAAANNGDPAVRKKAASAYPQAYEWLRQRDMLVVHG